MKKLLLSIAIVMALTSCEKEEVVFEGPPIQNPPSQIDQPVNDPPNNDGFINPPNFQWCHCCQMNHPYVQYPPLWNGPRHPVQNCN